MALLLVVLVVPSLPDSMAIEDQAFVAWLDEHIAALHLEQPYLSLPSVFATA